MKILTISFDFDDAAWGSADGFDVEETSNNMESFLSSELAGAYPDAEISVGYHPRVSGVSYDTVVTYLDDEGEEQEESCRDVPYGIAGEVYRQIETLWQAFDDYAEASE